MPLIKGSLSCLQKAYSILLQQKWQGKHTGYNDKGKLVVKLQITELELTLKERLF